jgi:hypothetical protein
MPSVQIAKARLLSGHRPRRRQRHKGASSVPLNEDDTSNTYCDRPFATPVATFSVIRVVVASALEAAIRTVSPARQPQAADPPHCRDVALRRVASMRLTLATISGPVTGTARNSQTHSVCSRFSSRAANRTRTPRFFIRAMRARAKDGGNHSDGARSGQGAVVPGRACSGESPATSVIRSAPKSSTEASRHRLRLPVGR